VAKRQFRDEHGVDWVVWDVHPSDIGRMTYDRRAAQREPSAGGSVADTRSVHPELQQGWLCFLGTEKRRFTPIPPNWEQLPDSVLRVMVGVASPAPQPEASVSNTLGTSGRA